MRPLFLPMDIMHPLWYNARDECGGVRSIKVEHYSQKAVPREGDGFLVQAVRYKNGFQQGSH